MYHDGLKKCKSCGQWKPPTDFYPNPVHWDRLSHICKVCQSARAKANYDTEKRKIQGARWYLRNRDRKLAQGAAWDKSHPESRKAIWHKYKCRRLGVNGEFTPPEWQAIKEHYSPDGHCLACGQVTELTMDHVKPVSCEGENIASNLQPICKSCNSSKGTKTIDYRPDKGEFARSLMALPTTP
jgi:5-methylcytosine-specific restriction endonuclease McrA